MRKYKTNGVVRKGAVSIFARLRTWLLSNIDIIAFGAALFTIIPLMIWWAALERNNIEEIQELRVNEIRRQIIEPQAVHEQLAQLSVWKERKLLMINGESALAALLLIVLALVLFIIARKRAATNRRVSSLLQFTTHELKTPIAGVRALLQSLNLMDIPPSQRSTLIDQGINECNRLEHLAETILSYQRAVAKANACETRSAHAMVSETLSRRQILLRNSSTACHLTAPANVSVDVDGYRVILENLLDNAEKYGDGQLVLSDQIKDDYWCLSIKDNGQGFEAADTEWLFDPFTRGPNHGGIVQGSGIGLYLSRRLARDMGGDLTAHSTGSGHGAEFVVKVPLSHGI